MKRKTIKWFFIYVLILAVIGGLTLVAKVLLFPVHTANTLANAFQSTTDGVINKTLNADNALSNYEWFKQEYEDYIAIQKKVTNAQQALTDFEARAGDRKNWSFEDKTEDSRLATIVTGLKQQEEDIISQYNAKSKMLDRNLFKSKDLPYQIGGN